MTDSLEGTSEERRVWLDQLHRRYAVWLRKCLVRRYGAQEAEDFIQDTWLRVSRLCETGEMRAPKAYLLKVASNVALQSRIVRSRFEERGQHEIDLAAWGIEESNQDEALLARQIVMSLPQPLRDVFVLSRVGGLSNVQIAEQLGVSPKTVEWRMTKALAYCAAQLRS